MASKRVLSVMMPVYNEEPTLETIAGHVLDRPEVAELVAIDDGSTDRSWEILQGLAKKDSRVRPFQQAVNGGKGLALRRAIAEIRM
ncbi:MAG: glycosyltransferase, partial [Chloroflexi bacterium]